MMVCSAGTFSYHIRYPQSVWSSARFVVFEYRGRTNAQQPSIGLVVNARRCLVEVEPQCELSGYLWQRLRRRHGPQPRLRQAFRYLVAFQDKLNNL
jgi:hypothetical protein